MRCIFGSGKYETDEEYKAAAQKKIKIYGVLIALGLFTEAAVNIATRGMGVVLPDFLLGFFEGIGIGLILVGILLMVKKRRVLANPEFLRKTRIEESDERNTAISTAAFKVSCFVMIVIMYIAGIILTIMGSNTGMVMFGIVCLFLIVYTIAYKIFQNKM